MGSSLGSSPVPDNIEKTKLKFGAIAHDDGSMFVSFGCEGQVKSLRKGAAYL
jgi:hypothetical protein